MTFLTNELKCVDTEHELLFAYSNRLNPELYQLKAMVQIPYKFNRVNTKIRWLLEKYEISFPLRNFTFKKKLNKTISDFKPDIIHCHFGTDFLKVMGNLNEEHRHIPFLVSFYGFDVTERIKNKAVLKKYIQFFNKPNIHSIAVSESLIKNINDHIKPYNKAILLHSGIDVDFFRRKESPKNSGEFIFLQVSYFNQKKGYYYTLKAFRKFIDENNDCNYKFKIVGFGPLENSIKDQIKELALENHVTMLPPVSPQEMVELSSNVDCFVQMSITADNGDQEGLPNVLLEAMSLELPILSTVHAGIPEIVAHRVNGILCAEKNIEEYVKGFKEISKWKKCPHNREKIINLFSFQAHMKHLNEIYKSIQEKKT